MTGDTSGVRLDFQTFVLAPGIRLHQEGGQSAAFAVSAAPGIPGTLYLIQKAAKRSPLLVLLKKYGIMLSGRSLL